MNGRIAIVDEAPMLYCTTVCDRQVRNRTVQDRRKALVNTYEHSSFFPRHLQVYHSGL